MDNLPAWMVSILIVTLYSGLDCRRQTIQPDLKIAGFWKLQSYDYSFGGSPYDSIIRPGAILSFTFRMTVPAFQIFSRADPLLILFSAIQQCILAGQPGARILCAI